jgi:hypothetical protein
MGRHAAIRSTERYAAAQIERPLQEIAAGRRVHRATAMLRRGVQSFLESGCVVGLAITGSAELLNMEKAGDVTAMRIHLRLSLRCPKRSHTCGGAEGEQIPA